MNISILFVCLVQFLACSSEKDHYTEVITEVFSVVQEDNQFKQGPLKFSESYIYDPSGREDQHVLYNIDKSVKGIEKSNYISGSDLPTGSDFTDGQDSLLSYYKFTFNQNDQLYKKIGFDAATDEMLRIELYHYDKNGNKIGKEIRSADDQIQQVYNYSYDLYGNEKTVTILNQDNVAVYKEIFENVELDKDRKWFQRWGYNPEGEPISFSVRRKRILKKSK